MCRDSGFQAIVREVQSGYSNQIEALAGFNNVIAPTEKYKTYLNVEVIQTELEFSP